LEKLATQYNSIYLLI